jgi:hypothetical protein
MIINAKNQNTLQHKPYLPGLYINLLPQWARAYRNNSEKWPRALWSAWISLGVWYIAKQGIKNWQIFHWEN